MTVREWCVFVKPVLLTGSKVSVWVWDRKKENCPKDIFGQEEPRGKAILQLRDCEDAFGYYEIKIISTEAIAGGSEYITIHVVGKEEGSEDDET